MMKTSLTLLFWLTTLAGIAILFMSIGWLLIIIGIVLVPVIIFHMVTGSMALNRLPLLSRWLMISSLSFLLFSLLRPDMDDVSLYTGYSVLLNFLGFTHQRYVHSNDAYFYVAILLLIATLASDIMILRNSRRPPPVPVNNDFV